MAEEFEAPRGSSWTRIAPIVVGLVLAVVVGLGAYLVFSGQGSAGAGTGGAAAQDLEPVIELYDALTSDAVDAPESQELIDGAIDGMLEELDDPYADYFSAEDFEDFNASLDGTFSGVGLMLTDTPEGPVIVSVLEDTPAQRAGIQEGERIVEVDGEDVSDEPLEQIVTKVKGEAGTTVSLGLAGGEQGRRTIEVTRAEFDLPLTMSVMLDGDIGYVDLLQFVNGSGDTVRREVRSLLDDGASGIVLDLRGNPGGLLNEAVDVASVFIEDGEIVAVEKRGGQRETLTAVEDAFEQVPLVVLVDERSASASEIVAGAVQNRDRGTIVGETTFGKGSVQTIAQFSDGSGAKFTTARYFTPSGDSIEDVGVEPDVAVEPADDTPAEIEEDPQVEAAVDELNELISNGG